MKFPRDLCLPVARRLFATLVFLLVVTSIVTPAQTPSLDAEEQAFLKTINDYRAQNGLGTFKVSIALTNSSKWFSGDMASNNYFPFTHVDSLGRDVLTRLTAFSYGYNSWRGENIAAGFADAASTFNQWKNSPGHNANMLNSNYTVIGIGRAYNSGATYRWYWTTDFGSYVDATMEAVQPPTPVNVPNIVTVNAANYGNTVTPDSLAAVYGSGLTSVTLNATAQPLPTVLGNTMVTVDGIAAQLLFVSPNQINYVVPRGISSGSSTVRVLTGNNTLLASGTVNVSSVYPSLFTVSASGQGLPAGLTTFDGIYFQPVANADGSARLLSVGTDTHPNYLVLFGTSIRNYTRLSNVQITIGGLAAEVQYAGSQGDFAGLDQLNVKFPTALRGRGTVEVIVNVDGRIGNKVTINIGS